jgi:murein L,D-transpeptidase YafK
MRVLLILFAIVFATPARAAPAIDRIIVHKAQRTLTLMAGSSAVRTIGAIKLGNSPVGHKRFQGDERTPEGNYIIDGRNGGSHYHLSLRISYPNAADRAFAARAGRDPGGDIFIHGQPNGYPVARIPNDWTDGCIALSNAEIEELWRVVKTGTRITILP